MANAGELWRFHMQFFNNLYRISFKYYVEKTRLFNKGNYIYSMHMYQELQLVISICVKLQKCFRV
jgi:hypothetical protein